MYFPCGLPSKWKVARKGSTSKWKVACKGSTSFSGNAVTRLFALRPTSAQDLPVARFASTPSCASISLNVDSFGYYFMSRKRSDKPFTKPSTLRGDSFGYYLTSRKRSDKPFMNPSTLRGDAPTNHLRIRHPFVETFLWLDFLQRRLVWTLLHIVKTIQQTVYESINPSWRTFLWLDSLQRRFVSILLHVPKMLQQTIHESIIPSWRYVSLYFHVFAQVMVNSAQDLPVAQFPST
ncbi:uncharacterized protein LACBIDRAFT_326546 [Laccaria bicolor S238N-H82]|uniref:Predicted protein n=1 Tax=Laccaria bicolor (strain S238N-H82 / ATCC MYA-4686) TaxID=486041 RepID=B0D8Z0_LACBS|nr:uncharacterized protein LACBIDRAFT_326546 [Laccaria bicolor S238N-H82]EDR08922.1 predicted protein [Laccaria bicolor S238N-H82]|eukprot:XP_001880235.1 predicted protein [Laccaria bicolor S238N-H82]